MKNKQKKENKTTWSDIRLSLSILHNGDTVVIKNRMAAVTAIIGVAIVSLCIACISGLDKARELPWFWVLLIGAVLATVHSCTSIILSRIVLDSLNLTITVYNPFKKIYKFSEINYIDEKKSDDKKVIHTVVVYFGNGKRNVEIATPSEAQAQEIVSLLRGMLDNAAIEYPEGNEESFNLDEDKPKAGLFGSLFKKKKDENEGEESFKCIKREACDEKDKGVMADDKKSEPDNTADSVENTKKDDKGDNA